jgi:murein DD-endopeptidase MepM/ murein hydrolase activator NlpD
MSLSSAKIAAFQSAAQAKTADDERSKLMKGGVGEAAKAFEAMFIKMLLDAMPEPEDDAVSGGFGGGVWRDMLHQKYAEEAAKQQGFGIAEAITRQMGNRGKTLVQPLSPLVGEAKQSSGFGLRMHPITGKHQHHAGVDFAAAVGTPVRSVLDAEVLYAAPKGSYGNLVELRHLDGSITRYAHLDSIDVEVGQKLKRGDLLGSVGSTGQSTGPHLHFELRRGGKAVDPESLLHGHEPHAAH